MVRSHPGLAAADAVHGADHVSEAAVLRQIAPGPCAYELGDELRVVRVAHDHDPDVRTPFAQGTYRLRAGLGVQAHQHHVDLPLAHRVTDQSWVRVRDDHLDVGQRSEHRLERVDPQAQRVEHSHGNEVHVDRHPAER
jgi:hypothetical protein